MSLCRTKSILSTRNSAAVHFMSPSTRSLIRAGSLLAIVVASLIGSGIPATASGQTSSNRRTPLVDAVAKVRPAVVNLRGRKTLAAEPAPTGTHTQAVRQVNGMGTGVIIDASGYILTNFHVVEDVRRIEVTLADGTTTSGTLIAHDDTTDLALIKIRSSQPLPVIPMGTSSDVMLAETVAALGNAYGYEDTVTRGIVSEIGRTVQVSDDQIYENLLQTDAPINPGNSGGPLINLDGEMIGINVAVRVGAQGIAFAIPVNDAIEVAADFLRDVNDQRISHGIATRTVYDNHLPRVIVESSTADPSRASDLQEGDWITAIDGVDCHRALDFERALLNKKPGESALLCVTRGGAHLDVTLPINGAGPADGNALWRHLGVRVTPVSGNALKSNSSSYTSGLRIDEVRPGSPAAREGIRAGDVLVAMHGWRTESVENLMYVLALQDVASGSEVVFYIIRNRDPFFGNIRISSQTENLSR
jgi:serine protease Do